MLIKISNPNPVFGSIRCVQKFAWFPVKVLIAKKSRLEIPPRKGLGDQMPHTHRLWLERYTQVQWRGSDCWYADYNFIVRD